MADKTDKNAGAEGARSAGDPAVGAARSGGGAGGAGDGGAPDTSGLDFIRTAIEEHNKSGRFDGRVHTRFPPEPSGYLHIGHAKAIVLDFGVAEEYGGKCNLRFDDTNPARESDEFVRAITEDIHWLGYDWEDRLFFASDYFQKLYDYAVELVEKGKAYVDSLSAEQITEYRGTPTEPGKNSPYRDRGVEENLDLLGRMKDGEFPDGSHVLRAKIDMAHPNLTMRDPVMYRIRHAHHHRAGDAWCIYPMYDWQHGLSDSIEGITHSLCTIEYEIHRPLYDWFLDQLDVYHPQQIEFAPLSLTYTMLGKRNLRRLVEEGFVDGWDDPRMPTISGLRRRGCPPQAIRRFCKTVGLSKTRSIVDIALFDHVVRDELNKTAPRFMAVLDPVKLVITNYPADKTEMIEAENNPEDPAAGSREIPFGRELYIERGDFMEDPPRKFFRLSPGKEVRLKHAYYVTCNEVVKDDLGAIVELRCSYDPESRGGGTPDGRKVKGTLHWVSAADAIEGTVHLYDRLFTEENMLDLEEGKDFVEYLNPESLVVKTGCFFEPALRDVAPGTTVQFLRNGYFCADAKTAELGNAPIFNRTVGLRDTWAKIVKNS